MFLVLRPSTSRLAMGCLLIAATASFHGTCNACIHVSRVIDYSLKSQLETLCKAHYISFIPATIGLRLVLTQTIPVEKDSFIINRKTYEVNNIFPGALTVQFNESNLRSNLSYFNINALSLMPKKGCVYIEEYLVFQICDKPITIQTLQCIVSADKYAPELEQEDIDVPVTIYIDLYGEAQMIRDAPEDYPTAENHLTMEAPKPISAQNLQLLNRLAKLH